MPGPAVRLQRPRGPAGWGAQRGSGTREGEGAAAGRWGPGRGGGGEGGAGGGRPGGALGLSGSGGAWAVDPAPRQRRGGAREGYHHALPTPPPSFQGNRVQQFLRCRRPEAPGRPPVGMCAAEVDHQVAQRYLLKRRLGKGAYGIVWKAVDRRTGEVVAIKKIFDAFRDKTDAQRTFREIMLLQQLGDHPNIIRLLDVIRAENDRDIYLVFESMDTDLNAVICKGRLLKDVHKRFIMYQLLRATKFIHSGGVIHRDQKPSNILLDASCLVKLCDFGLARPLGGLPEGPEGPALTDYVATRWYRAPEVLLSSSWYTPGVDMWSLGCVLGEMLRGRPLFPGTSTLHQLELILETIPPPSKEDLLALSSSFSASVLPCLGSRPRQTLDALLPPDTPPEALDLLKGLLVFAPGKRLSAAQALRHPYVQRFHCPAREQTLDAAVRLPVLEGVQLSAPEYRRRVYQVLRSATTIFPHPRSPSNLKEMRTWLGPHDNLHTGVHSGFIQSPQTLEQPRLYGPRVSPEVNCGCRLLTRHHDQGRPHLVPRRSRRPYSLCVRLCSPEASGARAEREDEEGAPSRARGGKPVKPSGQRGPWPVKSCALCQHVSQPSRLGEPPRRRSPYKLPSVAQPNERGP
uniref:mitogen-activated protein kinase 15 n=1 Tax=Panthera onca TaxID=9690 RepID=UPI0029542028|nr:mitogen-activated protein kinase 15 [Panthera onca]